MLKGDWIHRPTTTSQTKVMGMKIFIPITLVWLVVVGLWIQSPFSIWK